MADMTLLLDQFKAIAKTIPQDIHGTARFVLVLQKMGVNDTQEIATIVGVSRSMVQKAIRKAEPLPPNGGTPSTEVEPVPPTSGTCSVLVEPVPPSGTSSAPRVYARARIETPSGLSSSEEIDNTPTPSECAPKRKLGSRLPEDWQLPEDWRQWARINFVAVPAEAIQDQADRFRDFWIAKPGKGGTKLDWFATWRNWTREAFSTAKRAGQPMNWGRNAYDQRQAKGIDWDAVDARVAELNKRAGVYGHA